MKRFRIIPITATVFLGIAMLPANAQKGDRDEQPKHSQHGPQGNAQSATPVQHKPSPLSQPREQQQRAQPATHQQATHQQATHQQAPEPKHVQRSEQQARSWQQERGWAKQGAWQPRKNFNEGRSQNWASDHRDWAHRGGYGGYYIPQASFGVYFGTEHNFHIGAMPVMYMGYPRFTHGGYSFMLLDPWPGSWQNDWYASDDVYIDYTDGYYLHNRRYPGVTLAISVAL